MVKAFCQPAAYLGMKIARLEARVRIDVRALVRPFMEALHAKIGDNIDLTILEGDRVAVIEQIASHESIRVISYVGMQHPVHCTANGKAHLSMLPPDNALALIGPAPHAFTPRTETDPQAILSAIEAARPGLLFTDIDEYGEGASAMAVTECCRAKPRPVHRHAQPALHSPAPRNRRSAAWPSRRCGSSLWQRHLTLKLSAPTRGNPTETKTSSSAAPWPPDPLGRPQHDGNGQRARHDQIDRPQIGEIFPLGPARPEARPPPRPAPPSA